MLMKFPNLAPLQCLLEGNFCIYTSKDCSGASLMDLLDLTFLLYTIKVHRESKDREEVDRYEVEK